MRHLASALFILMLGLAIAVARAQPSPAPTYPVLPTTYNAFTNILAVPTSGPIMQLQPGSNHCVIMLNQPSINTTITPQGSDDTYVWHALTNFASGSITTAGLYIGTDPYKFFRPYFGSFVSPGISGYEACADNTTSAIAPMLNGEDGVLNTYQELIAVGHPGCAVFDNNGFLIPQGGGLPCGGGGGGDTETASFPILITTPTPPGNQNISCPQCVYIQTPNPSPAPGTTVPPQTPGPFNYVDVGGQFQATSYLISSTVGGNFVSFYSDQTCAGVSSYCIDSYQPFLGSPYIYQNSFLVEAAQCRAIGFNFCWTYEELGGVANNGTTTSHAGIIMNAKQTTAGPGIATYLEANSDGDTNGSCMNSLATGNDELGYVTLPVLSVCTTGMGSQEVLDAIGSHGSFGTADGTFAVLNTVDLEGVAASKLLCTDANKLVAACGSVTSVPKSSSAGTCTLSTAAACTATLTVLSTNVCTSTFTSDPVVDATHTLVIWDALSGTTLTTHVETAQTTNTTATPTWNTTCL